MYVHEYTENGTFTIAKDKARSNSHFLNKQLSWPSIQQDAQTEWPSNYYACVNLLVCAEHVHVGRAKSRAKHRKPIMHKNYKRLTKFVNE